MSNLSPAIQAIALQFARDVYSDIELDEDYGRSYMPAQIYPQVEVFVEGDFWNTVDLVNFTVVQLGMLADAQQEADANWWIETDAQNENDERDHEALIISTIAMGAGDRETALRWLKDADEEWLYVA
jgi:hypothetical protein